MYGRVEIMEVLYPYNPDLRDSAKNGKSALHFAYDEEKAAAWLLSKGADVDPVDDDGNTPLITAADRGYINVVKVLLENGAEMEVRNKKGMSALHSSISSGKEDVAELLMKKGAYLEIKNSEGDTPLLIAVRRNSKPLVSALLKSGANLEATNDDGLDPLSLAIENHYTEIPFELLDHGAKRGAYLDRALQMAAFEGEDELVQRLIELGANVNAKVGKYDTALQAAISGQNMSVIEELSKHQLDVNVKSGRHDYPLSAAASILSDAVPLLLEKGAEVDNRDSQGRLALHQAARNGRLSIFQIISKASKSELNVKDIQGRNVLHHGARGASASMMRHLLKDKEQLDFPDVDGWTALHWACTNVNPAIVDLLIEAGADPFKKCSRGWTPYYIAAFYHQEYLLKFSPKTDTTESQSEPNKGGSSLPKVAKGQRHVAFCDGCYVVSTRLPLPSLPLQPCFFMQATNQISQFPTGYSRNSIQMQSMCRF
jgi:ankyrin repeat protein